LPERLPRVGTRVRGLFGDSLVSNSFSLLVNVTATTGLGFVCWIVTARLFDTKVVGIAAGAVAFVSLIANFAQFGLNFALVRLLPTSKRPGALVNSAVLVTVGGAALIALATFAVPAARQRVAPIGGVLIAALVVVATVAWAFKPIAESVFTAMRRSRTVASVNVWGNVAKLAAVIPLAFLSNTPASVFVLQVVPVFVAAAMLSRALLRSGWWHPSTKLERAAVGDMWRFSLSYYVCSTVGSLPQLVLPIIVLNRLGPRASAHWYVAMLVANALFLLPSAVSGALLAEGSHEDRPLGDLLRRASGITGAVLLPALVVAFVAAPLILGLFGHDYGPTATTCLRWLLLSGVLVGVNYIVGAVLFIGKRIHLMTAVNVVNAAIVIGLSFWARSVTDIGRFWFYGEIANVALFSWFAARTWKTYRSGRHEDEPTSR
jgi:O-antigen/teichoic acid export membrane protein